MKLILYCPASSAHFDMLFRICMCVDEGETGGGCFVLFYFICFYFPLLTALFHWFSNMFLFSTQNPVFPSRVNPNVYFVNVFYHHSDSAASSHNLGNPYGGSLFEKFIFYSLKFQAVLTNKTPNFNMKVIYYKEFLLK